MIQYNIYLEFRDTSSHCLWMFQVELGLYILAQLLCHAVMCFAIFSATATCANCAADAARPCYQWQRFLATSQRTPCWILHQEFIFSALILTSDIIEDAIKTYRSQNRNFRHSLHNFFRFHTRCTRCTRGAEWTSAWKVDEVEVCSSLTQAFARSWLLACEMISWLGWSTQDPYTWIYPVSICGSVSLGKSVCSFFRLYALLACTSC